MGKCKFYKICDYYSKKSITCNKQGRNPYYCGKYKTGKIKKKRLGVENIVR